MGSKGRMPPPHLRRPGGGPGMAHPDPFGPGIRPPPGAFPPFDMLPPAEVMEQKLAGQHAEMKKLATENQRLAATHGTLRQELAAAQHELQMLHADIGAIKSRKDQQMRGLMEKKAKIEAELQASESVKLELQQAHADAQSLVAARQELISKVQQLSQDLQRVQSDVQQIPALMSERESLRQEDQYCRASYVYEKKLYHDHLESLQSMERNYMNMAREVEKLRAELTNTASIDRRAGVPYGGPTGYNENEGSEHFPVGQNNYEEKYGGPQGHAHLPAAASGGPPGAAAAGTGAGGGVGGTGAGAGAAGGITAAGAVGTPGHVGAQSGPTPARAGYDAPRGPSYDAQRGPGYDAQRGPTYETQRGAGYDGQRAAAYDAQRGPGYDVQRGFGYDTQRGPGYDTQRAPGYDVHRGPGYDAQRGPGFETQRGPGYETQRGPGYNVQRGFSNEAPQGAGYDASSRGAAGPQGQVPPPTNVPYGSATPPNRAGSGYEALPHGGKPIRR